MRLLTLIAVVTSTADDYFSIALDGDEESLRPESIVAAFPELLASVTVLTEQSQEEIPRSGEIPVSLVGANIGSASVCIVDRSFETCLFTRNRQLYEDLLQRFKECLPERAT
jgi:hypothetical protein